MLQNNWSPIYDVSAILTSIQSLLCDPNPGSPANSEAARLYTECRYASPAPRELFLLTLCAFRREYDKRVQEAVENSWKAT